MGKVLIVSIIVTILYILIVAKAPVMIRRNPVIRIVGVLSLGLTTFLLLYQFLPRYVFILCLVIICGGIFVLIRFRK